MKDFTGFGPHLMLDMWDCPKDILTNLQVHFDFLNEMPDRIGMIKITQPYVFPYKGIVPENGGITGFVVIAESHISVHSFEEKNFVFVDIFSCKEFNIELAISETLKFFSPRKYESKQQNRGKYFKHSS